MVLVARAIERIGDNAVAIAKQAAYLVTGSREGDAREADAAPADPSPSSSRYAASVDVPETMWPCGQVHV